MSFAKSEGLILCTKFLNSSASSASLALSVETEPLDRTFAVTKIGASILIAIAIASDGRESISISLPFSSSKKIVAKYVSFSTSLISTLEIL